MGREVGGGFRMGNTCTPMADPCQCMAKPLQYCKVISLQVKLINILKKQKQTNKQKTNCQCVWLLATLWTVAHQASLSMGFPRQEHWSGLPFPSPRDLPRSVIEPPSPAMAGRVLTTEPPGKLIVIMLVGCITL